MPQVSTFKNLFICHWHLSAAGIGKTLYCNTSKFLAKVKKMAMGPIVKKVFSWSQWLVVTNQNSLQ
jgi:hypothetical protein